MASIVTTCTGDAPGTGKGIKSGTTEGVCHPTTHSGNVRIRGEWAIRHDDVWEMNNRNTVGKLVYVKSTETFEETPAVFPTQNPEDEAPAPDVMASYRDAILGGMARASADPMPEGS